MEKPKNIPQLRFPEFEGEWKRKELGDLAIRITSKNIKNEVKNVFTNSAAQGIVNQRDFFDKDIANQNNLLNYYIVEKDCFIYNPRISNLAPVGPISRNHIGQGVMSPLYSVFKFKEGFIDFFEIYFSTTLWYEYMEGIANYGARFDRMNITISDFYKLPLPFPSLPEQTRIASFITTIDQKLSQLKQKKTLLEQYKKGVMQKIFSQELRFKIENENGELVEAPEWEKKKLGEVANITTGNKDTQNRVENGVYPFFVRSQTVERIDTYSFEGEAILTSGDGVGVGKNFHYINGKFDFHQRVYCINHFKKNVSGKFIFFYFSENFYKRVIKLSAKNSVDSVRRDMISDMHVNLPSLAEQTKIANFLSAIDEKINQTQKQIEKMELWKKGLLQRMFC